MSDELDFGPLACLIGVWEGDRGLDVAPEPDGTEESPYFERITFEAVGDVTNAKEQTLLVVSYHQVVSRKSNNEVFHDERGYWHWDQATGTVMQSFVIPRAVSVVAGGSASVDGDETTLSVKASANSGDWQIAQQPFMQEKAKTNAFKHEIKVKGHELSYSETTALKIYGKAFSHTDENTLKKVS
jgi:hypothetical protein